MVRRQRLLVFALVDSFKVNGHSVLSFPPSLHGSMKHFSEPGVYGQLARTKEGRDVIQYWLDNERE